MATGDFSYGRGTTVPNAFSALNVGRQNLIIMSYVLIVNVARRSLALPEHLCISGLE